MKPEKSFIAAGDVDLLVDYFRLDFEFTGTFENDQPELEPVFREGKARIVMPMPGNIVRGTLLDCPETKSEMGCVVVDTGAEALAVKSPVLRQLMIENAPCCLEFVAVPLQGYSGHVSWDWEAYEFSPHGERFLVSDPHCEFRVAPASEWAREVRDIILPALQREIALLGARQNQLHQDWRGEQLSLADPSSETAIEAVKELLFGPAFRQAKQLLRSIQLDPVPGPQSIVKSPADLVDNSQIDGARTLLKEFHEHAANPLLRRELDLRIRELWTRRTKVRELVQSGRDAQSRLMSLIGEGHALIGQLDTLGTRLIRMRRSTVLSSRHLSLPDASADI